MQLQFALLLTVVHSSAELAADTASQACVSMNGYSQAWEQRIPSRLFSHDESIVDGRWGGEGDEVMGQQSEGGGREGGKAGSGAGVIEGRGSLGKGISCGAATSGVGGKDSWG